MGVRSYFMMRPERGRDDLADDVFDASPDPSAVLDVAGAILRANPALAELCGQDRNDLVGRDFAELLHREDAEAFHQGHARALVGGGGPADEYEARLPGPAGERWVAWRARAVGRRVVLAGRDVTHARHAPNVETSMSRLDARLERLSQALPDAPADAPWGKWLQAVAAAVVAVFGAGVGFAAWQAQNATDDELDAAVETLTKSHARYEAMDVELAGATQANADAIEELSKGQKRLRRLAEYQYEFAKWRADVEDDRAKGRRPRKKPPRLEQLERALLTGTDETDQR